MNQHLDKANSDLRERKTIAAKHRGETKQGTGGNNHKKLETRVRGGAGKMETKGRGQVIMRQRESQEAEARCTERLLNFICDSVGATHDRNEVQLESFYDSFIAETVRSMSNHVSLRW